MTGGFDTHIRGIQINVIATLNKFLNQNKKQYTFAEFIKYLKDIGLNDKYQENTGQKDPINDGFVVVFDLEESNEQDAVGYLVTGLWEYQNWVPQTWSEEDLKEQINFNNSEYLSESVENNLKELWKNKLILEGKLSVMMVDCEWGLRFFPRI